MATMKFLEFLGQLLNLGQIAKYQDIKIRFNKNEAEFMAHIIARFGYMLNESIDEVEAVEILKKYLEKQPLSVEGIHELGHLVRSTILDEDRHVIH